MEFNLFDEFNLFSRELDFSDELDEEVEEIWIGLAEGLNIQPEGTFSEFLHDYINQKIAPKTYILDFKQLQSAILIYRTAYRLTKKQCAKADIIIDHKGVFKAIIHLDYLIELYHDDLMRPLFLEAISISDAFHIIPVSESKFQIIFCRRAVLWPLCPTFSPFHRIP